MHGLSCRGKRWRRKSHCSYCGRRVGDEKRLWCSSSYYFCFGKLVGGGNGSVSESRKTSDVATAVGLD